MTSNINGDLPITGANGSCACCAPGHADAAETQPATVTAVSEAFLVSGMTCGHCVASVSEELSALEGVEGVDIELNTGGASKVTVASASPIDVEKVRAAVAEAGYDLVLPAR
jgi:copper chaperone CopZ